LFVKKNLGRQFSGSDRTKCFNLQSMSLIRNFFDTGFEGNSRYWFL